jgi:hypothetical protein
MSPPGDGAPAAPPPPPAAPPKAHTSALCIVPPASCWGPIQRARCFSDKSFTLWPPHVNLLYPFVADGRDGSAFESAAEVAAAALRDLAPFEVTLDTFGRFDHRSSSTVWLNPDNPGGFNPPNFAQTPLRTVSHGPLSSPQPHLFDTCAPPGVLQLQAKLQAAFPDCFDLPSDPSRGISGFASHLSLGQWRDAAAAEEAIQQVRAWAFMCVVVMCF